MQGGGHAEFMNVTNVKMRNQDLHGVLEGPHTQGQASRMVTVQDWGDGRLVVTGDIIIG